MTETTGRHNSVAPLANVVRLRMLLDRIQTRAPGLPGLGCFHGPAGHGKTTGGIYLTNTANCVHIEALPFGGAKGLMENIARELGLRPERTLSRLFDQVAADLALSGRPLLLDEADKVLSDTVIETVRRLHDVSGVPVILMGEETLPQKLQKWERVHSRMLAWVATEPASAEDVRHLAPIYARGIEVTPDLMDRIHKDSRGSVRYVSTNLAHVAEFARSRGMVRVSLADWGGQALHTGIAPTARRVSA